MGAVYELADFVFLTKLVSVSQACFLSGAQYDKSFFAERFPSFGHQFF